MENAGVALGDGRAILFWLDQWVEPSRFLIFAAQYVPLNELDKHVHEYCDAQGGWKWDDVSNFFPHPIWARVASFELL